MSRGPIVHGTKSLSTNRASRECREGEALSARGLGVSPSFLFPPPLPCKGAGDTGGEGCWIGSKPLRLVLASASPRRRELISALDRPVEVIAPQVAEPPPREGETAERLVARLSVAKARDVARRSGPAIVLGADTAVVVGDAVLGKPTGSAEAIEMLRRLRGRAHVVVTGLTAIDTMGGRRLTVTRSTEVVMRGYSDAELDDYVATGDPLDKAGGYAVQDEVFKPALRVLGCYLNVVGLPLCEVVGLLARMGAPARTRDGWRRPERCTDCLW